MYQHISNIFSNNSSVTDHCGTATVSVDGRIMNELAGRRSALYAAQCTCARARHPTGVRTSLSDTCQSRAAVDRSCKILKSFKFL